MAHYTRLFHLGVPQVQILNSLGVHGTLASKEITSNTAMNKALVSRSLGELTKLGYTEISSDAADGRRSLWKLTKKGEDFVAAYRPIGAERRAKLLKVLTPEEQTLLAQFIEKLYASSEDLGHEEATARRAAKIRSRPKGNGHPVKAKKARRRTKAQNASTRSERRPGISAKRTAPTSLRNSASGRGR